MKTIEEKAKAYDEALKWMRELYPGLHGAIKEDAEHHFPGLAEFWDERNIDTIFNCLYQCCDTGFISGMQRDNALAWLEKQKEPCCTDEVKKWKKELDSLCKEHYGQKSSVWNSPIMTHEMIIDEQKPAEPISKETCLNEMLKNGQISLSDYLSLTKEQKPVDEQFEEWLNAWYQGSKELGGNVVMSEEEFKNWSRGIKNMYDKPAEWSEEDEKMLARIIERGQSQIQMFETGLLPEHIAWLKSLRPPKDCSDCSKHLQGYIDGRSDAEKKLLDEYGILIMPEGELHMKARWKPSEEQMVALDRAIPVCMGVAGKDEYSPLISLYEQLKKL